MRRTDPNIRLASVTQIEIAQRLYLSNVIVTQSFKSGLHDRMSNQSDLNNVINMFRQLGVNTLERLEE